MPTAPWDGGTFSHCARIYPEPGTQIFNQGGENCNTPYLLWLLGREGEKRGVNIGDLSHLLHSSPIILFSIALPSWNYTLGLIFAITAKWAWGTTEWPRARPGRRVDRGTARPALPHYDRQCVNSQPGKNRQRRYIVLFFVTDSKIAFWLWFARSLFCSNFSNNAGWGEWC